MDLNYRLTLTIELDTDSRVQAERWEQSIIGGLDLTLEHMPVTGVLVDLELVDEYGAAYNAAQ